MAVLPSESPTGLPAASAPQSVWRDDPRIRLAQLARLYDEAAETSLLANLLGRAPRAAEVLAACALVVAAISFAAMPVAQIAVWLALVGVAIAAPFERAALKNFAGDLSAILFYAGFAWGAGAFLALPAQPIALVLFTAVPAALIAGLLRARDQALFFLAPVAAFGMAAALIRPVPQGLAAAAMVAFACALIAGVSHWIEKNSSPKRQAGLGEFRLG
jgi:hypothetical protein